MREQGTGVFIRSDLLPFSFEDLNTPPSLVHRLCHHLGKVIGEAHRIQSSHGGRGLRVLKLAGVRPRRVSAAAG